MNRPYRICHVLLGLALFVCHSLALASNLSAKRRILRTSSRASGIVLLLVSSFSHAGFFERAWKYLHVPTGRVIELRDSNPETGTAREWRTGEVVNLSDLSREKDGEQYGVSAGEMILVKAGGTTLRACQAYYVFENGYVDLGCLEGRKTHSFGYDVVLSRWTIKAQSVIAEVKSLNGFDKKSCAKLKAAVGDDLEAGGEVRVDVIFANGEVLVRNNGFNLIDTTQPVINRWMRRTTLSNLEPCPVATTPPSLSSISY